MVDTTSNPQVGFDWEDACLDPYHGSLLEGKTQGREAGALSGFRDGHTLGQDKGMEFGMEIGFYQGVLEALLEPDNDFNERISKSIQKLQEAIDAFPSPDELFSQPRQNDASILELKNTNAQDDGEDGNDSEDPTKFDVLNKMQRVRARFKLLAVQLEKPQFSLRSALEGPADYAKSSATEVADQDW